MRHSTGQHALSVELVFTVSLWCGPTVPHRARLGSFHLQRRRQVLAWWTLLGIPATVLQSSQLELWELKSWELKGTQASGQSRVWRLHLDKSPLGWR